MDVRACACTPCDALMNAMWGLRDVYRFQSIAFSIGTIMVLHHIPHLACKRFMIYPTERT
ncbi:MAG: hypothetical protein GFH27_549287n188 [Chloroflexi bacterium AL-W]|nr:hypothetical protein [Chloroflexi bacterium AL-N1]NOK66462.1 hypothetical protein [Chloroflexi bacterium AL-N10]NOK71850.1 hypothetical protein [Chloroflexi bacterium AL-N5]NOK81107.1 hypothetical protein [Chloroflexi bacterium AL-W]NOK89380.1 hypothetical protein [Chloroflexi bacterium AL-N15]